MRAFDWSVLPARHAKADWSNLDLREYPKMADAMYQI
jgi:hypothetical protein